MKKMPGNEKEYLSVDRPLENDVFTEHCVHASDQNIEAINNETPSGMPPHQLILKKGAPIMLIRNIDVPRGLCNGTRLQILAMTSHNLKCKILTGPNSGQIEYIRYTNIK